MGFKIDNENHNWLHWLTVVIIRLASFLMITPPTIYLACLGLIFFLPTARFLLANDWLADLINLIYQLPYLFEIKQSTINFLGSFYWAASDWWALTIALPLFLTTTSILVINLANFLLVLLSPTSNRIHCPLCQTSRVKMNWQK